MVPPMYVKLSGAPSMPNAQESKPYHLTYQVTSICIFPTNGESNTLVVNFIDMGGIIPLVEDREAIKPKRVGD